MHPAHLLTVKQRILKSSAAQTRAIAQKMLRADDPDKLRKLLDRLNI
jgi:phosphotransferase system enzyme I (PtsI)